MNLNKLIAKDSYVKGVELWGWYLNLIGVKLYAIKSWETIMGVIKNNWKSMDQIEIGQIPN
jgi:hypothetical protein